jgi:hypothetical protein
MDILSSVGALGGSGTYPDPIAAPAAPPAAQQAANNPAPAAFSPAVADAPSPTPQSILIDTKDLPPNVRYAPSAVPRVGGADEHFDRSA